MRLFLAGIAFLLLTVAAQAETKTFLVENEDGYGVDRCLVTGATCGVPIARAYCRSQAFADARSFRKVADTDITASLPARAACQGTCNGLIAIECTR
jgi:hypothetical protein